MSATGLRQNQECFFSIGFGFGSFDEVFDNNVMFETNSESIRKISYNVCQIFIDWFLFFFFFRFGWWTRFMIERKYSWLTRGWEPLRYTTTHGTRVASFLHFSRAAPHPHPHEPCSYVYHEFYESSTGDARLTVGQSWAPNSHNVTAFKLVWEKAFFFTSFLPSFLPSFLLEVFLLLFLSQHSYKDYFKFFETRFFRTPPRML